MSAASAGFKFNLKFKFKLPRRRPPPLLSTPRAPTSPPQTVQFE